jgi:hypothetical protein
MHVLEALREEWRGARTRAAAPTPLRLTALPFLSSSQTITRLEIEAAWVRFLRQTFNNHDPTPRSVFCPSSSTRTTPHLSMRDPIPAPALFIELTRPLANKLSLTTLPYHAHEVLLGFLWYHFILYYLSPTLSRILCPQRYNGFNKRTRLNWDIHWVSMIQALFVNAAALYVIFSDPHRKEMDWKGRLWGYTPASGMVQGFAAGA